MSRLFSRCCQKRAPEYFPPQINAGRRSDAAPHRRLGSESVHMKTSRRRVVARTRIHHARPASSARTRFAQDAKPRRPRVRSAGPRAGSIARCAFADLGDDDRRSPLRLAASMMSAHAAATPALRFTRDTLRRARSASIAAQLSRANQVDCALLDNSLRGADLADRDAADLGVESARLSSARGRGALQPDGARVRAAAAAPRSRHRAHGAAARAAAPSAPANSCPSRVPAPHAATYAAQNPGLKSIVTGMIEPHKGTLSASQARAPRSARSPRSTPPSTNTKPGSPARSSPPRRPISASAREIFDTQLGYTLQSNLSRAEIRARADAAVISVREEMYRVSKLGARRPRRCAADARHIRRPSSSKPLSAPRSISPPPNARARDQLVEDRRPPASKKRAAFVQQHDLITLPEGPVRVILMPEFQRGVAVAYCDSPGPLERHLETFYAVSPIPDDWTEEQATSFLREYNNRGIARHRRARSDAGPLRADLALEPLSLDAARGARLRLVRRRLGRLRRRDDGRAGLPRRRSALPPVAAQSAAAHHHQRHHRPGHPCRRHERKKR